MEDEVEVEYEPSRKDSGSSGFYEIQLTPESSPTLSVRHEIAIPIPKPEPEHKSVRKTTSLRKRSGDGPFDGALHMGYLWYYNQNPEKKSPEELRWKAGEERLARILRMDPQKSKNWKRFYAVIYNDGRFAWYRPTRMNLYNRRVTGELEEVLFIPWRVCAFGSDVVRKLAMNAGVQERPASAPVSPRLFGSSPPSQFQSILDTATNCLCGSPSITSLITPSSSLDPEAAPCILPKTSREELLMAVGGHDWTKGDIYCFATESDEDLAIWRESFAFLSHRKIVERSAFDNLLNTPVMISLP